MKNSIIVLASLFFCLNTYAQSVRSKDKYGVKLYFFDGQTIRTKDKYGDKLYYIDGQTIRTKDKYGDKIYYFEGIPEKWVIICLIR